MTRGLPSSKITTAWPVAVRSEALEIRVAHHVDRHVGELAALGRWNGAHQLAAHLALERVTRGVVCLLGDDAGVELLEELLVGLARDFRAPASSRRRAARPGCRAWPGCRRSRPALSGELLTSDGQRVGDVVDMLADAARARPDRR